MKTKQTFLGLNKKKRCFNTVAREQEEGGGIQEKLIRIKMKRH